MQFWLFYNDRHKGIRDLRPVQYSRPKHPSLLTVALPQRLIPGRCTFATAPLRVLFASNWYVTHSFKPISAIFFSCVVLLYANYYLILYYVPFIIYVKKQITHWVHKELKSRVVYLFYLYVGLHNSVSLPGWNFDFSSMTKLWGIANEKLFNIRWAWNFGSTFMDVSGCQSYLRNGHLCTKSAQKL